jgi:hypothetical protein
MDMVGNGSLNLHLDNIVRTMRLKYRVSTSLVILKVSTYKIQDDFKGAYKKDAKKLLLMCILQFTHNFLQNVSCN